VENIHRRVVFLLDLVLHFTESVSAEVADCLLNISQSNNRYKFVHLRLVVYDLSFIFGTLLSFELTSNCRVAGSNQNSLSCHRHF
jgi:hypothetical protein